MNKPVPGQRANKQQQRYCQQRDCTSERRKRQKWDCQHLSETRQQQEPAQLEGPWRCPMQQPHPRIALNRAGTWTKARPQGRNRKEASTKSGLVLNRDAAYLQNKNDLTCTHFAPSISPPKSQRLSKSPPKDQALICQKNRIQVTDMTYLE